MLSLFFSNLALRSSHQHDPKEAEGNRPVKAAGQGGDLKLGEDSGVVPPLPKFNSADTFSSSLKIYQELAIFD